MVEKIKTDVDRLLLAWKIKKVRFQQNLSENLFSLLKPKECPFLSSLLFSKF